MGRSGCIKIALCLPRVISRTSAQLQAPSALCRELAIERSKQKDGNQRSVGPGGGDRVGLEVVCSIRDHCGECDTGGRKSQSPQESPLQARGHTQSLARDLTRSPWLRRLLYTHLHIHEFLPVGVVSHNRGSSKSLAATHPALFSLQCIGTTLVSIWLLCTSKASKGLGQARNRLREINRNIQAKLKAHPWPYNPGATKMFPSGFA